MEAFRVLWSLDNNSACKVQATLAVEHPIELDSYASSLVQNGKKFSGPVDLHVISGLEWTFVITRTSDSEQEIEKVKMRTAKCKMKSG
jgi:hypothetical protein